MKLQLYCIALIALISVVSTDESVKLEGETLTIGNVNTVSGEWIKEEIQELFGDKKVTIKYIDLSTVYIYEDGFGNLIKAIDSIVDRQVKTILVNFGELLSILLKSKYYNVLAEIEIIKTLYPRVVPIFKNNTISLKNSAYDAYTKMHNTTFDKYLTIELPSFNDELSYARDGWFIESMSAPFAESSDLLYDYVFAGVNFSKVKVINLFHLSLFNYLRNVDLSNLQVLNFDYSLYSNEDDQNVTIYISEYVKAILSKNSHQSLIVTFDKKASALIKHDVNGFKKATEEYGDRLTFILY